MERSTHEGRPLHTPLTQVQIKLSIQRLRTLQEKKQALAKKSRREIADLVSKSRIETAKLRVEGLIQDDIYVELLELLEVCKPGALTPALRRDADRALLPPGREQRGDARAEYR